MSEIARYNQVSWFILRPAATFVGRTDFCFDFSDKTTTDRLLQNFYKIVKCALQFHKVLELAVLLISEY